MKFCNACSVPELVVQECGGDIDEKTKKKVDEVLKEIGVLAAEEIKK